MKNRSELLSDLDISLKRLSKFSKPEFKNVYSKQYGKNIIFPSLENEENPFTFVFGDFNKLGVINNTYGHSTGTTALNLSLDLIQRVLPSDSTIVRLGGDEFVFIIPNSTKDECEKYLNDIHTILEKNSTLICGLSIEMAASDSTKGDISELYSITEGKVDEIKASRKNNDTSVEVVTDEFIPLKIPDNISKDEANIWHEINEHINVVMYNFLQNIRPSNKLEFTHEQIQDASSFIFSSVSYLLNSKTNTPQIKDNDYYALNAQEYPAYANYDNDLVSDKFAPNTAKLIHSLVTNKENVNLEILSDEAISALTNEMNSFIENDLIRNNNGLFTKFYFKLFLADQIIKSDKPIYSTYVSTAGIKLSNSAYGHDFTDYKLDKTNKLFLDLVSENFDIDETSFEYNSDKLYVVNYGAGDYLFLYPDEQKDEIESKVGSIVEDVNSNANLKDPNSSLLMSYAIQKNANNDKLPPKVLNTSSKAALIESIKILNDNADFNKDIFKKMLFNSTDALITFKKLIDPLLDTYLNKIDESNDINRKSILLSNFYRALLNYEVLHNETRDNIRGHSDSLYEQTQEL